MNLFPVFLANHFKLTDLHILNLLDKKNIIVKVKKVTQY